MKHLFFIGASAISFLILMLYLIEILSDSSFELWAFIKSFIISIPFMVLLIFLDYKLVSFFNRAPIFTNRLYLRIILELLSIIVLAALLVIIGNIPFYGTISNYIMSENFIKSIVASTLINTFTILILEYISQLKKNQMLIQENLQIQYNELKNQINPHFLFNSLNILTSLINKDSQAAVRYTKKLSDVYRYVLTSNVNNVIPVEDEIKFITNYIEILKIRYGNGFNVAISINPTDLQKSIIPMASQIVVENAVKHNIISEQKPLLINISSDGKHIIVSNTINPRISVEPSTGIGIPNLEKKYRLISDKPIEIEKSPEYFTIKLPLL